MCNSVCLRQDAALEIHVLSQVVAFLCGQAFKNCSGKPTLFALIFRFVSRLLYTLSFLPVIGVENIIIQIGLKNNHKILSPLGNARSTQEFHGYQMHMMLHALFWPAENPHILKFKFISTD